MPIAWVWVAAAVMAVLWPGAVAQDGRAQAASMGSGQAYPTRPVRMVIHIGPGSSMDIVGRVLAEGDRVQGHI